MGEKFEPLTSSALIIVQVQSIAGKNEMWKWARKQNKKYYTVITRINYRLFFGIFGSLVIILSQ